VIAPTVKATELKAWLKRTGATGQGQWVIVTDGAPTSLRQACYAMAVQFRREMHFDFPPLQSVSEWDGAEVVAHLAYGYATGPCFDAGLFLFPDEDGWTMGAAWVFPYSRGRGLVAAVWPALVKRYGDFYLEPPISPAMRRVLRRVGHPLAGALW
jgi:hypothetical protein